MIFLEVQLTMIFYLYWESLNKFRTMNNLYRRVHKFATSTKMLKWLVTTFFGHNKF
jgi:hypothetical protein